MNWPRISWWATQVVVWLAALVIWRTNGWDLALWHAGLLGGLSAAAAMLAQHIAAPHSGPSRGTTARS